MNQTFILPFPCDGNRTLPSAARCLMAILLGGGACLVPALARAERSQATTGLGDRSALVIPDSTAFNALRYRNLGPSRGGRATAAAGVPNEPHTFYAGYTGGGVWKTTNAGTTWRNISDGFFPVGSIGAIAVSESNPRVLYVGTGSAAPRSNVSTGKGVYRSTDAGKTWTFAGLPDAGQIAQVRVHPIDPEIVYVAALGHIFGPNPERGVFRTTDGGAHWAKVLFLSDSTGAVDLVLDPGDPRVMYAAMWRVERKPWIIVSGAREGGVYKSLDGGDRWTKLTGGLPTGLVGRIGITVSPANPRRVWVLAEAADGEGLYRSDDAGVSFRPINLRQKMLMARPWYYTRIFADPKDEQTVYVTNETFWKSTDGGAKFAAVATPHGDNHALWINPRDPKLMIETNDGGANVTLDGGATWSTQLNQPTGEFYSVVADDRFPYRVYAPQQDNTTISLPSRVMNGVTPTADWKSVGGCETGPIALDPGSPEVVYAGCYGGRLSRWEGATGQVREIAEWPHIHHGQSARDLRHRFQWNAPILLSRHDHALYHASQYVLRSTTEGQSWQAISGDLTRNDSTKETHGGGPITWDMTGAEVYPTVFALAESPTKKEVLWAGTNDGLVHVSRNRGRTWSNATPAELSENTTINRIDVSPHAPGRVFVAAYRYQLDDWRPLAYRTDDYGRSWTLLTSGANGIPGDHPVRVVREDPERRGLLYAGSEFGLFVSFDDGGHWQTLQLNLPRTPVLDLQVHHGDLLVATQGRGLWILDDLTPIRAAAVLAGAPARLLSPRTAFRVRAVRGPEGANPADGAVIDYVLNGRPTGAVSLEIFDGAGRRIRGFSSESKGRDTASLGGEDAYGTRTGERRLPAAAGHNRFVWDLKYPAAYLEPDGHPGPDRDIIWGYTGGPAVVPGRYLVRLRVGLWSDTQPLDVRLDPRVRSSPLDLASQRDLMLRTRDALSEAQRLVRRIRDARAAIAASPSQDSAATAARLRLLGAVEDRLVERRDGDVAKLRPQLSDQLAWLNTNVGNADSRPTAQALARFAELSAQLEGMRREAEAVLGRPSGPPLRGRPFHDRELHRGCGSARMTPDRCW